MSNAVMNACRPVRIPPTPKNVLMAIADRADDDGKAWPSLPGLCEATCFSRTAVIEAVRWLEQNGFVKVEKASGRNNRFQIDLQQVANQRAQHAVPAGAVGRTAPPPVRKADQYGSRTGTADEPVRQAYSTRPAGAPPPVRETDYTRPGGAPEPSVTTIQPSENHQQVRVARSGIDGTPGFLAFWDAYPKKVAKQKAMRAFAKLKADTALLAQIMAALHRHTQSEQWRKADGQFIPHPTTWLNEERWADGASAASSDTKPAWACRAGFPNRYEAESAGCFERNAHLFHDGQRLETT